MSKIADKIMAPARLIRLYFHEFVDTLLAGYLQGYMRRKGYGSLQNSIKIIRRYNDAHAEFSKVFRWPDEIGSFEDLYFLFHLSQANFGLCLLSLDEAAYLYKIVKTISHGRIAEIGRFKGGSTFLMAAALEPNSLLDSFDKHSGCIIQDENNRQTRLEGNKLDSELRAALARYSIDEHVNILVHDSTSIVLNDARYDLVFIDGDHSYEGAKKDFLAWKDAVKKGGHLLFHDAARTRPFCSAGPDLLKLIEEVEKDYSDQFEKVESVGTLVDFRKFA
jgi:predicted O-methyltransferase YrrM